MNLRILGKDGPYPKEGGATSGYLLTSTNATVVFELGSGTFSALSEYTDIWKIDALILSHFHFDHCCDAGVLGYALLRFAAAGKANLPLKIYCPATDSPLCEAIKSIKAFELISVADGDEVTIRDLTFKFYKVNHPVPCFGFKVTDGKRNFAYGGDSNECDNLEKLIDGSDLALLDGGFLEKDWSLQKPHLSVKRCADLAEKYGVKTIITHQCPDYDVFSVAEEMNKETDKCILAEKGKIYGI